jgi:hypothetical protein
MEVGIVILVLGGLIFIDMCSSFIESKTPYFLIIAFSICEAVPSYFKGRNATIRANTIKQFNRLEGAELAKKIEEGECKLKDIVSDHKREFVTQYLNEKYQYLKDQTV